MKTLLTHISILAVSLMIASCSSENDKASKIAEPQLKALEKAKNVEAELLKRKKQIDDEEVKY